MKILLIEDDISDIEYLNEVLSDYFIESSPVIPEVMETNYDLIIVDFFTEDGNNLSFLKRLSRLDTPPPVLIISGFIDKINITELPLNLNALLIQKGKNFEETLQYYLELIAHQPQVNNYDYKTLLFNLIHDLKNDLGIFNYLIADETLKEKMGSIAIESGCYAFKRIQFLSTFINSETDEYITLKQAMEEVLNSPQIKEHAAAIKLTSNDQVFKSLPNYFLITILKNLIENSCKFQDESRELKIYINHEITNSGENLIISDNSIGMTKEKAQNLLHKKQTSNTGLGYGLYLINNIISGFGGKIKILSSKDAGTTIFISF